MTSQPPDPETQGDEELDAFMLSGSANSGGYKNISRVHANASISLNRIIQTSNETLFEYYWPLTLSPGYTMRLNSTILADKDLVQFHVNNPEVTCQCHMSLHGHVTCRF